MTMPKVKRNKKLYQMRMEGKTFGELAEYFGISRSQAEAIFKRMLGRDALKNLK